MLELIFRGFIEWMYGLTLECWEYFSSVLLDIMSMDFSYLRSHMPVIDPIMQSMLAVGWALLIGNLVFQALRSMMTGLGFECEDPKLLFTRTFVFSFLLLASSQICQLCLNMTSTIISIMEIPDAVNITFADEASFAGLACAWLLVVICGVIVMFQSFKLIFEMAERYFILAVLTITAPLAFAAGGSRNTSDIFTGWCRMYGSMCLLMVMNVVFVKMLLSVLSYYPSGLDVLPWMVLVLTVVKVAKKIDAIITRIGLNPAITGDSLGRMFPGALTYMVMRTATGQITKAIGKSAGNSRGSSGSPNPPGNGPKTGGPASGKAAASSAQAGATASSYHQTQATSQQNPSYQQSTTQQESTVQPGAAAQAPSHEQPAGTATHSADYTKNATVQGQQTRKSAVPPGTRRSPSHVKSSAQAGAVAGGVADGYAASAVRNTVSAGKSAVGADSPRSEAAHPGTAGKQASVQTARFTQAASQTVHQKYTGSRTETAASISTDQKQSASPASAGKTPGNAASPQTDRTSAAGMRSARQTHADSAQNRSTPAPAPSSQPSALHHDSAGISQPRSSYSASQSPRPGRNIHDERQGATSAPERSIPTPQESRPSPSAVPSGKSEAPRIKHGTAGMAPATHQAPKPNTTAARQTLRARSSGKPPELSSGKRVTGADSGQSRKSSAKGKKERGANHHE